MTSTSTTSGDATSRLVVITSASGQQASHLLPHLYNSPQTSLRLVVHSDSSASRLKKQYPSAEIVTANLRDASSLIPILHSATHAYHIGPGFHPHETQLGYNIIDAAISESRRPGNRFRHFVYSSVLNTQLRKLLNHDAKRYVEEYLIESGLNWTILQPTNFMNRQMLCMLYAQPGREEGKPAVWEGMWDPDVRFSMVALRDLGEVGAKVMSVEEGERHYRGQYPMVSTEGLVSYREFVGAVGKATGREVVVKGKKGYREAVDGFVKMVAGEDASQKTKDGAQRMLLYYDNYGLQGSSNIMGWLLGRKPTQLNEWAKMEVEALEKEKS